MSSAPQTVHVINDGRNDWMIAFDDEGVIWNGPRQHLIAAWKDAGVHVCVLNMDYSETFPLGRSFYANISHRDAKALYNELLDDFLAEVISSSLDLSPDFLKMVEAEAARRQR